MSNCMRSLQGSILNSQNTKQDAAAITCFTSIREVSDSNLRRSISKLVEGHCVSHQSVRANTRIISENISNIQEWSENTIRLRTMASSGMLHRVALIRIGISEELSASLIRATRSGEHVFLCSVSRLLVKAPVHRFLSP
jgi:hypothetical protein